VITQGVALLFATDNKSPTFRKATEQDLPAVLALYAQPDLDDGYTLDLPAAQNLFRKMQSYPNYALYVAEIEDKVIGTFALLIMDNLAHQGRPSGVAEDVVVNAEWRGKGVGKQMMAFAIEKCREAGCYKLALSSNLRRTQAHKFYETLGFERHGYSFLIRLTD
jgi:GNAT superfamily N-acetyltransferase